MPSSALHVARTGLEAQDTRMRVIANNLANVGTTGFKRDRANFATLAYQDARVAGQQSSGETAYATGLNLGTGVGIQGTSRIDSQGSLQATNNALDLALDGSDGAASNDPLIAVCAHGKHDQCCAVRGRAATAAIASAYPEWTWECSHLGGDRFAATGLLLPHGLCYGRLDTATDPASIVELYTQGRLDDSHLRGRTSLPHAVQAAQHYARVESGDDRIDSFSPLSVAHDDGQIRVRLSGAAGPVEVVLGEQFSEPLFSMCEANVAGRVRQFTLKSINAPRIAAT